MGVWIVEKGVERLDINACPLYIFSQVILVE